MHLSLRLLGLDVLDVTIDTDSPSLEPERGPGDCTTYPVGFTQPDRQPIREVGRDTDPD